MSELGGDFDLFSGDPGSPEQSEKNDEKFREQQKGTQKAIKDLQKEEGKAKRQDDNLAQIIVQFLSQPENTDLFLLISRAVGHDIPSELIIAIISLIDEKAAKEVIGLLEVGNVPEEQVNIQALAVYKQGNFDSLPPEHKKKLDIWIKNMIEIGMSKPHRILESVIEIKRSDDPANISGITKGINPTLIQLSSFILRRYLEKANIESDFEKLHEFMQNVFVSLISALEEQTQEQKVITGDEA